MVEPLAILIMAYLGYMVAEVFHWSGILSLVGENESVYTNPVQTKMLSNNCRLWYRSESLRIQEHL